MMIKRRAAGLKNISYKQLLLLITYTVLLFAAIINIGAVIKALNYILHTIQPMLIGIVFALSMDCLVCSFEKNVFRKFAPRTGRVLSVALSVVVIISAIAALLWFSASDIITTVLRIAAKLPSYLDIIVNYVDGTAKSLGIESLLGEVLIADWSSIADKIGGSMSTVALTIYDFVEMITNVMLGFVFSIYVLLDKARIKSVLRRLLSAVFDKKLGERIYGYTELCAVTFKSFIAGQVLEAIIIGGLCFVGMVIIGLPYACVIAVLIGVTSVIPVIGAYIGAIPSALLLLLENPVQALVFIIFLLALQQFESAVIYPKVVGEAVGIDGMFVLTGVILGAGLGGIIGMLIGVPLVSVMHAAIRTIIRAKEKNKKPKSKEE